MKRLGIVSLLLVILTVVAAPSSVGAQTRDNLFFLHHSTGRNVIDQGALRTWLQNYNSQHGTHYLFWDHDYNYVGLRRNNGSFVSWIYNVPNDNTDPIGLYQLWTTANAARDSILHNHDVIAFKSCYPASAIPTPQVLAQYKTWYRAIRDVLDQHPEKTFVVISPPPLHRLATNLTEADNARAFANWLKSAEFLDGHENIVCFDLFDVLAAPNTPGAPARNMLRYEYELSHSGNDSHPNAAANVVVAPLLGTAMVAASRHVSSTPVPTPGIDQPTLSVQPNPFNPATVVSFDLPADASVRVELFDLRGQRVRDLLTGDRPAGPHQVRWDGRDDLGKDAAAGVYVCRLETDRAVVTRRLVLVR
jgi:hypothetical protein